MVCTYFPLIVVIILINFKCNISSEIRIIFQIFFFVSFFRRWKLLTLENVSRARTFYHKYARITAISDGSFIRIIRLIFFCVIVRTLINIHRACIQNQCDWSLWHWFYSMMINRIHNDGIKYTQTHTFSPLKIQSLAPMHFRFDVVHFNVQISWHPMNWQK